MQHKEYWPNLFVPGAGKSGTSSLHDYLNQHPDIWMSIEKEPVFFDRLERYKSIKSRKHYLSLFAKGKDKLYRGESSTNYMVSEDAALRIEGTLNNPKFIFILRNPIDRAFSHYNWLKGRGFESRSFQKAFLDSYQQFENKREKLYPSYYSEGLYATWIGNYIRIFEKENIHLTLTENLKSDTLNTLNGCFAFLGLPPLEHIKNLHKNESVLLKDASFYRKMTILLSEEGDNFIKDIYRFIFPDSIRIYLRRHLVNGLDFFKDNMISHLPIPVMDKELRAWVKNFYTEEVVRLGKITSLDCYPWKDFQ
ncbi:sulfotransferase family protein [Catalinimonas niigatensis]|uniref:sulfotransferase family protein n=1 Tax=Catalinimonas niigatensis TaxID=1397264 RepID=UPI0026651ED9|nr:sulfotransferase [Catalinimonas niigatensis]WPP53203.1 sulfotransferase [Catalinimonas niigatensis]